MSLLFRRIRQPVVLGYLVAGMIVGPYTPPVQLVTDVEGIRIWAELGVIFLMFSLGLEFSFRKLARAGTSAVVTAGLEVLFFLPAGYLVGKLLGWTTVDSIFLGAMLSISSTTIIIKALEELNLKTHRFAELVFATLIVEDLIAILLLVALSTVALTSSVSPWELVVAATKLILIVGSWMLAGYFLVPPFMKAVGRLANNELVTLLSLGLCLGLVVVATHFNYSTALGAFIMGSILAETELLHRIEGRMEALRDLFGAIFFVSIGMLIDPRVLWEYR
ncbi:MAG: cation:proton antiporter, partial [Oligoflexia bacterium]|nr:cation:proton antiporter [Oligoflexia bacterium]